MGVFFSKWVLFMLDVLRESSIERIKGRKKSDQEFELRISF